jgi:hypothetical protein
MLACKNPICNDASMKINPESRPARKYSALLATGLAAATLAACGGADSETPVSVPEGSVDLGAGSVSVGRYATPGHSFLVKNELVRLVHCGSFSYEKEEGYTVNNERLVRPAESGYSQVDCAITGDVGESDIKKFQQLAINYVASSAS